jgi:hypothetical protein
LARAYEVASLFSAVIGWEDLLHFWSPRLIK